MDIGYVFVPGGNGFLGSHVVKKLKDKGFECLSLSRRDGFDFRNFEQTRDLFEEEKFDAVINCAAFVGGIQFGYEKPGEIYFNNILMSTYLMESARLSGVKKYINPISNCAYPAELSEFKEDEFWNGELHESVLTYGFVRKASWVQSWAYNRQYSFNTTSLILPNMYGPGDHFDETRSHALGALIMKFVEAEQGNIPRVNIWGTGKPIREWLFVEDGADIMVEALNFKSGIDPINIGIGKGISIADLAYLIKDAVGYRGDVVFDPSKPDGAVCKIMNVDKMHQVFDWNPAVSLKEGIEKTIEWYKDHGVPDEK